MADKELFHYSAVVVVSVVSLTLVVALSVRGIYELGLDPHLVFNLQKPEGKRGRSLLSVCYTHGMQVRALLE